MKASAKNKYIFVASARTDFDISRLRPPSSRRTSYSLSKHISQDIGEAHRGMMRLAFELSSFPATHQISYGRCVLYSRFAVAFILLRSLGDDVPFVVYLTATWQCVESIHAKTPPPLLVVWLTMITAW